MPGPAQVPLQVLHNHVRPAVVDGRAAQIGTLPANQQLRLGFHLPVRNHAELRTLLEQLSDPGSANYRHWLSVSEFTERFGPTEEDYQKVMAYARANGFTVTKTSPNRLLVHVTASTAQIERAFHVHMNVYQHPTENRTFYSPDAEPSLNLPVALSHISGLNNYSMPRPAAGPGEAKLVGHLTGTGPAGTFLGSDMRTAYNMGSNTGAGQVLALIEYTGYNPNDISRYFQNIGQTNNVPIVNIAVDGADVTSYANVNNEGEVCLDIEQAVGVAPGLSSLRVYISNGLADGDMLNQIVTDNIAKQISNSWYWYPDDPAVDEPYFEEAAAQGQSIFSISGDKGAYTGSDSSDESFPAEDPNVTTVGGTDLQVSSNGAWASETAWLYSGGGPANDGATYFAIPSWQVGAINSLNQGSTTLRNSPDVALQSDYVNYICYNGGCATNWGGTSFATPRWAAYLALVNQQLVANGQAAGLGFLNPTLYQIGQSARYSADFHDIDVGNNRSRSQSVYWNAVTGYDLVTGWGSMNGTNLMADLLALTRTSTQTITFNPIGTQTTGSSLALSATASSGLAVSFSSLTTNICIVSGNAAILIAGGVCTITASQSGNNTYATAPPVSRSFTVLISQIITFGPIAPQMVGGTLTLTAAASSGLAVNYSSATGSVCTVSGNVAAFAGAGTCIITAAQAGNGSYAVASPVSQSITVTNAGATAGLQFVPVTPCRVVDTRLASGPFGGPILSAGSERDFAVPDSSCGIPANAAAYALNVTVVPAAGLSFLAIWPAGVARPLVSTLNSDSRVKANAAIVPAGTNGAVAVYVTDASHVILDINGYFVSGSGTALEFYPVPPCRIADTRGGNGTFGGPYLSAGATRPFPITTSGCGIPSGAHAYSLNFTAIPHSWLGFLTVWPAGQAQPGVSTLNSNGTIVANAAIVPAGTAGGINTYATNDTDLVIDVNGYFAPAASGGLSLYNVTPCRVLDTRFGAGAFQGIRADTINPSTCMPSGANAQAFVLNATVVPQGGLSYLTLWPSGQAQPTVSTLNAVDGAITANMAIVPTSNGVVSFYATDPTQLILDLSAYFAP